MAVNLATDQIVKKIIFPPDVVFPDTGLNDVRFDLHRGSEGMAFITDTSNSLIVVDLATLKSWRRLTNHVSTSPDPKFVPVVEGEVWPHQPGPPETIAVGADGIAISSDGETLYYCPAISRHLYSVSLNVLADPSKSDAEIAATVKDLGEKGGGSDGLESDAEGRVYLSNYEHHAIHRRLPNGQIETIVYDPRVLFPDTLSLASDGYLYFTSNQVGRIAGFNNGQDHRQKPYVLFRVKVNGTRIS
jgi:sugar lactone lactonase YvrE